MADTDTTVKDLWCATCGSYRGTTDRPHYGPHRAPTQHSFQRAMCFDTNTFTDD